MRCYFQKWSLLWFHQRYIVTGFTLMLTQLLSSKDKQIFFVILFFLQALFTSALWPFTASSEENITWLIVYAMKSDLVDQQRGISQLCGANYFTGSLRVCMRIVLSKSGFLGPCSFMGQEDMTASGVRRATRGEPSPEGRADPRAWHALTATN